MKSRPLVIAHRGQSATLPEQTMIAYRTALELGADMIEADVQRTADGRLVMLHDRTLDRTTSGSGLVSMRTFDEVRTLDAGSWFHADHHDERVPSLEELFALAAEHGAALCLEAKGGDSAATRAIALAVGQAIAERGRLDVDVLASFDHEALALARERIRGLRVAPDRLPERGPSTAGQLLEQAERCGARIIQHHCDDLDTAVVRQVQDAGVEVWAWPATTPEQVRRALASGVAGIMGDDVAAIVAALT